MFFFSPNPVPSPFPPAAPWPAWGQPDRTMVGALWDQWARRGYSCSILVTGARAPEADPPDPLGIQGSWRWAWLDAGDGALV